MPFAIKAKIEGIEQALKNLSELTRTVRNKILRKAINGSSRLILNAAKALVPKGNGMLKKSLGIRVQTYRASGTVVGIIGPRTGYKKTRQGKQQTAFGKKIKETGQNPAKYAHLVEFGRAEVRPSKKKVLSDGSTIYGTVARSVPPRPFLRPAFEQTRGAVVDLMAKLIDEELKKAAKALKK